MVFCNMSTLKIMTLSLRHNPYFNRWFSAIYSRTQTMRSMMSHNPYFNRWLSAIDDYVEYLPTFGGSQTLF